MIYRGGLSMAINNKEQEDKSKVKLYKTKHGWFSALTRFFKIFAFRSKREVKTTDFNDLDSLKNMHNSDTADAYKKGGQQQLQPYSELEQLEQLIQQKLMQLLLPLTKVLK